MSRDATKLLIADDDLTTGLLLSENTKKWGYHPIVVTDGLKALEILQQPDGPKIAILDWLLPGLNGLELVKKARELQEQVPHYIIILTSKGERTDVITALESGADDFILKPFDPAELKARLNVGKRMVTLSQRLAGAIMEAKRLADFIAHYDQTTGLPNYNYLLERLNEVCNNPTSPALLLFLNIDNFKIINQVLGMEAGDLLLNYFGARLKGLVLGANGLVSRLTADEFAILIQLFRYPRDKIEEYAKLLAQKIHESMEEPYLIKGENITIHVSIGAAIIDANDSMDPEELIRRADFSLRKAKKEGGNRTIIYNPNMEKELHERYALERDLKKAIKNGELVLYLQPQFDCHRVMKGAEALVRWRHPEKGLILPGKFIPIAEESELIIEIGEWVLCETCLVLRQLKGQPISASVNISPGHFSKEDFVKDVKVILKDTSVDPKRLILEVTEGLLIKDVQDVVAKMDELASLGIHFSIDDFGTGYSSLMYLKRLPISEIKIDRGFIQGIPHDENDTAIVNAMIAIGQNMNLKIVAEGVETQEQVEFLMSKDRNLLYQGFFFSKPGPWQAIIERWCGPIK